MITVVQDNLNTHTHASLYKAFKPAEARRIINRLDFCYTPKHGSWRRCALHAANRIAFVCAVGVYYGYRKHNAGSHLNMAEIELSALSRQCLDRRIPDMKTLSKEVSAWCDERNEKETWID